MVKEIGIRPDPALSIAWQTDICGCVLQAGKLTLSDFSVFTTDYKMKYAIAMMALISLLFSGTGMTAETSTLEQIKSSKNDSHRISG